MYVDSNESVEVIGSGGDSKELLEGCWAKGVDNVLK